MTIVINNRTRETERIHNKLEGFLSLIDCGICNFYVTGNCNFYVTGNVKFLALKYHSQTGDWFRRYVGAIPKPYAGKDTKANKGGEQ